MPNIHPWITMKCVDIADMVSVYKKLKIYAYFKLPSVKGLDKVTKKGYIN